MAILLTTAAGGLALFILAMSMMTDGLKLSGGHGLKSLLQNWASSTPRAAAGGALVTAVVQSSSAVTVATIGFVNAGILTLGQALGVVFGANVGTTMTGWLVSLTGVGFKIEAMALPLLAIGVTMRLVGAGRRIEGFGTALAGFGLFFLGLAILKEAFAGVTDVFGPDLLADRSGFAGMLFFVGIGFVATAVTQSSSAAIAIVLTAASQGVIGIEAAAAAVIGANIGTTSTALLASLNATANARRVAAGHIVFNVVTGIIGLALLSVLVATVEALGDGLGLGHEPVTLLALFHTVFNLLGLALMLPLSGLLARYLERLFRSAEEDLARPRHLDRTVLATPALALAALVEELRRLQQIVEDMGLDATRAARPSAAGLRRRTGAAAALGEVIVAFATSVRMESLQRDDADALAHALRSARYLEEAARLAPVTEHLRRTAGALHHEAAREALLEALEAAAQCIERHAGIASRAGDAQERLERFRAAYDRAKAQLLASAVAARIPVNTAEAALDDLSRCRRMVDQIVKAQRALDALEQGRIAPRASAHEEAVDAAPPAGESRGAGSGEA